MKPKRFLKSDRSGPAAAEAVRAAAAALVKQHGVAELVAEGRLAESFPFTAELPPYDPKKARQRRKLELVTAEAVEDGDDLVPAYEEVSPLALAKYTRFVRGAPVVEIPDARVFAVGRSYAVVEIGGMKVVLKIHANKAILETALTGSKTRTRIVGASEKKQFTKLATKFPSKIFGK